jgi:hypothetical protein
MLHVAHERLDGGQARVARPRAVAPLLLEILKERHHEQGVDLLKLEIRRPDVEAPAGELEQKLERVGVRVTCVRARAPLDWQPLT